MVKFNLKYHRLLIASSFVISTTAFAEVSLIDQSSIFTDHDQFKLTTSGSLRLQALNFDQYNESNESQKYRRNGYSATSRIYANAYYKFNDEYSLLAGYQNYINPPKILDWEGHYAQSDKNITTEQAYMGISSQSYGTLKYGKIYSLYYDVVGIKTDLWDYDTLGQAQTWSPVAYYDGTQAASKTLRYEKKTGLIDYYAAYLFKDDTQIQGLQYQRQSGQEAAIEIHLNKNTSWAVSWKHNAASLSAVGERQKFDQDLIATSLFYFNGQWVFGIGGGWYKNLLPNYDALSQMPSASLKNFLNTEAYGFEYYAGYQFKIADHGIKFVQPYVMGNYLKYSSGYDFSRRDHGVGVAVRFEHGFGFDYERLYTQDSYATPDMHLFRLRYEW
ncbi:porin [Acinetobacter guerrae]|uniref:Porin n=1 Tax=Acinetobacter guerrae TaxID=1843371 RepID=A0A3A8F3E6_9GAMM|nr:porin [Acinetobacter guerrae]RKG35661.1 porin [Acinetobacter guerrae]